MDDVFAVQDDIARTVVEKLKVELLGDSQKPLVTRPTDNIEAYNLVLQGRYHSLRVTGQAFDKAIECFTSALTREPAYAQAQAGVAMVQAMREVVNLAAPHTVMPEAKEAALKTLALDESVSDAHTALGFVYQCYEWDWTGAEREYRRALELNPGDELARRNYANLLGTLGQGDPSIAEARSSVEHDPLSAHGRYLLSHVLTLARRFEEATAEAQAGMEFDPSYYLFHSALGLGLAGLGRLDEAVEVSREGAAAAPGVTIMQPQLGWTLGLAQHRQEALTVLEDLERRRREDYVGGVMLAWVCVGLGDHEPSYRMAAASC